MEEGLRRLRRRAPLDGLTSDGVYQHDGSPTDLTVYHEFATMAAAKAFAASPRLREVMRSASVQGAPDIWFANRV